MNIKDRIAAYYAVHKNDTHVAALSVVAVVGVGSFFVFTQAAGFFASVESEVGTKSTNAQQITDTSASAGSAVKFTATTPSPGGTDFCSTSPAMPSVKPTAANTGVPAGTTLTPSGSITVNTAGAVIEGKDISGDVYINANNVTIRNNKIHPTGGFYTIQASSSATGIKIINNEIYQTAGGYIGIALDNAFICGNYVHGYENAMTLGSNVMVQANYIDKLKGLDAGAHYDGIEIYDGGNSKYWGNNILMTDVNGNWLGDTGAINLTSWHVNIDNVEINGNWMGGGSYTLYVDEQSGYRASNVRITNNRWYGSPPTGYAMWGPHAVNDPAVTAWSGNVWDATGITIPL